MTSAELARRAPGSDRTSRLHGVRWLVAAAAIVALYVHAWRDTHVSPGEFVSSFPNLVRLVGEMFPPDWSVLHA